MSGKTRKALSKFKSALLILFALIFLSEPSCEIGLGPSVDTKTPELSIKQPKADISPIRGEFVVKGKCDDDGEFAKITLTLKGVDSEKNDKINKEITVYDNNDKDKYKGNLTYYTMTDEEWAENQTKPENEREPQRSWWSWNCKIDPFNLNNENVTLIDGSYEITVYISDTYGHEVTDKVAIRIDNTPPILVLTRPATAFSSPTPDTFGQDFFITGQSADNSDVASIEMNVFTDEDCTEYWDTIILEKIPPTIDMTAMKFVPVASEKFKNGAYENGGYRALYGDDIMDGTKKFYYTVAVYDDARPLEPNPEEGEDADKGNKAEYYYLYNDIFSDVLSTFKLTQVYSIINGTFNVDSAGRDIVDAVGEVKEILGDGEKSKRVTKGSFALNPLNNPTFAVSGYDPLEKDGEEFLLEKNQIANDSKITIKVSSGLDNIPLDNDTLGINAYECDNYGKRREGAEAVVLFKPAKDIDGNPLIEDEDELEERKSKITEVGSYDRTIVFDMTNSSGLIVGRNYVFEVIGCDQNRNTVENNGRDYGFYFKTNGAPPTLDVESPTNELHYINDESEIVFKGTLSHDEGTPTVSIYVGTVNEADLSVNRVYGPVEANDFDYTLDIPDLVEQGFLKEDSNTVTVRAEYEGKEKSVERSLIYDKTPPTISVTSIMPVVASYTSGGATKENCVNGSISITGTMFDQNGLSKATYVIKGGDKVIAEGELPTTRTTFTLSDVNTLKSVDGEGIDECGLSVVIAAVDRAGNAKEYELLDDGGRPYYIWQESDKPTISFTDLVPCDSAEDKDISGFLKGSQLYYSLTDDDGLNDVTIEVYDVNGGLVNDDFDIEKKRTLGGKTSFAGNFALPSVPYYYKVRITATDKEERTEAVENGTRTVESWLKVESGAPTIDVVSGDNGFVSIEKSESSPNANGLKSHDLTVKVSGEAKMDSEDPEDSFRIYLTLDKANKESWVKLYDSKDHTEWQNTAPMLVTVTIPEDYPYLDDPENPNDLEKRIKLREAGKTYDALLIVKDSRKTQEGSIGIKFTVDDNRPIVEIKSPEENFLNADGFENGFITNSGNIKFFGTAKDSQEAGHSSVSTIYYQSYTAGNAPTTDPETYDKNIFTSENGWKEANKSGDEDWNFYLEAEDGMNQVLYGNL